MLLKRAPVTCAAAFACIALAFCAEPLAAGLAFERQAILSGELWRLWTAHFVHFSLPHAMVDALVLIAMGMLAEPIAGPRRLCAGLVLGTPLISLGLLLCVPDLFEYCGASGMATMVLVLAGFMLWPAAGLAFKTALACGAAGFAVKPLFEAHGNGSGLAALPIDVAVAWQAHLLGAACGIALALAVRRILLANDYAHAKLSPPQE